MALHDSKWAPVAVSEPGGTGVCTYSRVQCGALSGDPTWQYSTGGSCGSGSETGACAW